VGILMRRVFFKILDRIFRKYIRGFDSYKSVCTDVLELKKLLASIIITSKNKKE
jgi:hypothetical protein